MKKLFPILLIFFFGFLSAQLQNPIQDWDKMTEQQRKEAISKLSPEERRSLFRAYRENLIISQLNIPKDNQEQFTKLYSEYQNRQREIKDHFHTDKKFDQLSDDEARQALDKSFVVGQQLLDNRKEFTQRFLKILKPQQVLKMYHMEGKTRKDIMDKREESKNK